MMVSVGLHSLRHIVPQKHVTHLMSAWERGEGVVGALSHPNACLLTHSKTEIQAYLPKYAAAARISVRAVVDVTAYFSSSGIPGPAASPPTLQRPH